MAAPVITDLILYTNTPLTDTDYAFNWNKVIDYFTDGTSDCNINSLETTGALTVGGAAGVTGLTSLATLAVSGTADFNAAVNFNAITKTKVTLDTTTSVPDNTETLVPFDTKEYDNLTEFSTVTHKWTASAVGLYQITARILWAAGEVDKSSLIVYKNTTQIGQAYGTLYLQTSGSWSTNILYSEPFLITAGDTISIKVYQHTTIAVNLAGNGATTAGSYLAINRII